MRGPKGPKGNKGTAGGVGQQGPKGPKGRVLLPPQDLIKAEAGEPGDRGMITYVNIDALISV